MNIQDHPEEHSDTHQVEYPSDFDVEDAGQAAPAQPDFTSRAVIAGVIMGGLLCCSNMYFGLQTGFITMGSLQASMMGYGFFKLLKNQINGPFTAKELVLLQSTAVATATMPLAAGFVGIIPALAMMTVEEDGVNPVSFSWIKQLIWSGALAFFGAMFAVPLRKQLILKEQLPFPSGTATAKLIHVLHAQDEPEGDQPANSQWSEVGEDNSSITSKRKKVYTQQLHTLLATFCVGGLYQLITAAAPIAGRIPVLSLFGLKHAKEWGWVLTLAPGYLGQGMIMGTRITLSMLLGSIIGWALLGPMARSLGWAPGEIKSLNDGGAGWILWISLTLMLCESIASLGIFVGTSIFKKRGGAGSVELPDPAKAQQQVPTLWWVAGLVVSSIICAVGVKVTVPEISILLVLISIVLALLCAVLAVRALGQTDVNPVSGIGKITQLAFALLAPGQVTTNLVAGAIAEAGAMQAGDMMQDLKTGHLVGASPRAQFYGQLIGSCFSIFFAVGAFQLFTAAYTLGEPPMDVPVAGVWLQMARLLNHGSIDPTVQPFCIGAGIIGVVLPIVETTFPSKKWCMPSGLAIGIGMYLSPNYVIPRALGGLIELYWKRAYPLAHENLCFVVASGFVLGEGLLAMVVAAIFALA